MGDQGILLSLCANLEFKSHFSAYKPGNTEIRPDCTSWEQKSPSGLPPGENKSNVQHSLISSHLQSALQGEVNYRQLQMKSEIQMNSKEEDSGSDQVQPSCAAQRACDAGQVAGSPMPVHAPGVAFFSPQCLQVAGKEPRKEGQAVPRGQGMQQGSCHSLEHTCRLSQHVTMQKITDKVTQARLSEQMQSPHSLWPPCSVQKRKERSGVWTPQCEHHIPIQAIPLAFVPR